MVGFKLSGIDVKKENVELAKLENLNLEEEYKRHLLKETELKQKILNGYCSKACEELAEVQFSLSMIEMKLV